MQEKTSDRYLLHLAAWLDAMEEPGLDSSAERVDALPLNFNGKVEALQIHNFRDKSDFLQIGTSARFGRFRTNSIFVTK